MQPFTDSPAAMPCCAESLKGDVMQPAQILELRTVGLRRVLERGRDATLALPLNAARTLRRVLERGRDATFVLSITPVVRLRRVLERGRDATSVRHRRHRLRVAPSP